MRPLSTANFLRNNKRHIISSGIAIVVAIIFSNRKGEFSVLNAMGYKKSRLILKLWCESAVSCFVGYAAGILFTMLVGELLNLTIYQMQGKDLSLYSGNGMLVALTIPIAVSFISILPCLTSKFSIASCTGGNS